jgi:hypothetical protein
MRGRWGPGRTFWIIPKPPRRGRWGPGKTFWIPDAA